MTGGGRTLQQLCYLMLAVFCRAENVDEAPRPANLGASCQTRSPTECERTIMWLIDREFDQREERRSLQEEEPIAIEVYLHVLAKERSNSANLKKKHAKSLMSELNKAFEPTPFDFVLKSQTLSRNDTWHECNDELVFKERLRAGGRDSLNVYICDTRKTRKQVTSTFSVPTPLLGLATFPHELDNLNGGLLKDGVLLRNPASKFLTTLKELPDLSATTLTEVEQTLIHECGHWLGLLHTFEGGCSRSFATSGVASGAAGDGVSDTGAEDGPAWDKPGWFNCFAEGKIPDSCPNGKKGVDSGKDPVFNYMDYVNGDCTKANGEFTELQVKRMIAQFQRFRAPNTAGRRRRLKDAAEEDSFIPDTDLIEICLSSAVRQCNCDLECFNKFRDLLRDWLPFHEFVLLNDKIFEECSQCAVVGTEEGCIARVEYCEYGNTTVLGHRCLDKKTQHEKCWTSTQCKSNVCTPAGRCGGCSELASEDGCKSGKFCESHLGFVAEGLSLGFANFVCKRKGQIGARCHSDASCLVGVCTGGLCSSCRSIGSQEDCPPRKACRLSQRGRRRFYKCSRWPKHGIRCREDKHCPAGESCISRQCSQCKVVGLSDGCNMDSQYCDESYKCRDKIESANLFETPTRCWKGNMCQSGHCIAGFCRQCPTLGSSEGCESNEVCIDYACNRKQGDSESCRFQNECRSNDCRLGRCYGECSKDTDCGQGGSCRDQFCVIEDRSATLQRYFNTYDCRLGTSFQRCRECLVSDHCEQSEFCSGNGKCIPKVVTGACSDDRVCASGQCSEGRCEEKLECNKNGDCAPQEYCAGYKCHEKKQSGFCTEHFSCLSDACNEKTQQCDACRSNDQCDSKYHCLLGRCTPKQCEGDDDCQDGQVCMFQGAFSAFRCVDCFTDDHCLQKVSPTLAPSVLPSGMPAILSTVPSPFPSSPPKLHACDLSTNSCQECTIDDHCPGDFFCRGNECIRIGCRRNRDCKFALGIDGRYPRCKKGKVWSCVQCIKHSDCQNATQPFCDVKTNKCEACLPESDRGCDKNSQFCVASTATGNTCVDFPCLGNSDCAVGEVCLKSRQGSKHNACSQCRRDFDCGEKSFCLLGRCRPKLCETDADCENALAGQHCDTRHLWECRSCTSSADCGNSSSNGTVCVNDLGNGLLLPGFCYECSGNEDCRFDSYCEEHVGICRKRQCASHSDCEIDRVCSFNDDGSVFSHEHSCVMCTIDDHCQSGTKRRCKDNVCVECSRHQDCSDGFECDPETNQCVAPPCSRDSDCPFDPTFGTTYCLSDPDAVSICGICDQDIHCPPNWFCSTYISDCQIRECFTDDECRNMTGGFLKFCSEETYVEWDPWPLAWRCIECRSNADCLGQGYPESFVCDTFEGLDGSLPSYVCVPCVQPSDCNILEGETCDTTSHQCVKHECLSDKECPEPTTHCALAIDNPFVLVKNRCVECDGSWARC